MASRSDLEVAPVAQPLAVQALGQQGVGLLEFFEHVAVNLLLAVVGRIELAFGIPLTGLEVGRIAERIGDVRERQHFEDAGNGQPRLVIVLLEPQGRGGVVLLGLHAHGLGIAGPAVDVLPEVVDDRVVEAVVVDALG